LKICIFSPQSRLASQMKEFAIRFVSMNHEVHAIIASSSYGRKHRRREIDGSGIVYHVMPVIPVSKLLYPSYVILATIRGLLVRNSVTISHEVYTGLIGVILRFLTGRKSVLYVVDAQTDLKIERGMWRNSLLLKLGRWLERFVVSHSDVSIAIDQSLIPYLKQLGAKRVEVVTYGIKLDLFNKCDGKEIVKKHCLPEGKVVGYVGGMEPHHGVQYLVEAIPYVIKEIPDVKFLIVGNGLLRPWLEEKAGKHGVFPGHVPYHEVPKYLAASDILVVPAAPRSKYVSVLTTKIFDYLGSGKAIIATDVGGIKQTLGDVTLVVPPRDPKALANAILHLIKDRESRRKMGLEAKKIINIRFNYDKLAKRFVKILEDAGRDCES